MSRRLSLFLTAFVLGFAVMVAKNTALLIGIGNYNPAATGWSKLHGNNDVSLLETKLKAKGFFVSHLTDSKATKNNIKAALTRLVGSVSSGDIVYLHFSGHGQLVADMNNDEQEGLDQSFVCYDACFSPNYKVSGKSYRGQNHFIDDELFPYLNNLKRKVGKKGQVIVVFDTCYSGGEDRGEQSDEPDPESDVEWTQTTRGTDDEFRVDSSAKAYLRSIAKPADYASDGGNITIISACESDKKNYECKEKHSGRKYGSLSFCIAKMLDRNIEISQWGEYFRTRKYKSLKIFRASQNPVVEIHK